MKKTDWTWRQSTQEEQMSEYRLGDNVLAVNSVSDNDFLVVDRFQGLEKPSVYL